MHSEHAEADDAAVGFDAVEHGHGSERGNCDEAGAESKNNHCAILNDTMSCLKVRFIAASSQIAGLDGGTGPSARAIGNPANPTKTPSVAA